MEKRSQVRFDGWLVNFDSGEISKNGVTNRLQDQPLQILDELVRHAGAVVTREQLIARLWPTGVVEFDTGLNTAVRKLRVALGDDADTPRYIETLPRKGYRFIAPLEPETIPIGALSLSSGVYPTLPPESPARRRATDQGTPRTRLALGFGSIFAAIVIAVIAWHLPGGFFEGESDVKSVPTVVVLPLVDMSTDQSGQHLCDGLTEEMSNWLAHIPSLRVVARTSAFAFKGQNTDVRKIGAALGATHVLEGSLRRSGDDLRVTVQLISSADGLHLWSKSFDMPIGSVLQIEDTVARSVAEALHLRLLPGTPEKWLQRSPTKSEAYELYLLGRARLRLRTPEDNLKAAEFFRKAIAADPKFALAYTALAQTRLNDTRLNGLSIEDATVEIEPLLNQAFELAPQLTDALAVKGWLRSEQSKFDEAFTLLRQAVKANPNDAPSHRYLGSLYERLAQPAEALTHYDESAALDPLDFISHVFRCLQLSDLGRVADATSACERARVLGPNNFWGPLATSWVARGRGDTREALEWIDAARKLEPHDSWLAEQKIELLVTLGRIDDARAVLKELPADGSFNAAMREANVEFAAGGARALAAWLKGREFSNAVSAWDLGTLARMQVLARDPVAARATLQRAARISPFSDVDLSDATHFRHGYSALVLHAAVEIKGGGDAKKGMEMLARLDKMLDVYEQNGGANFGLYTLRAESQALQGKKDAAAASLAEAWKRGWRASWRARLEPFLEGVPLPKGA